MSSNTLSTNDFRDNLSEILSRAGYGGEYFIVERHGKEVAGIVPAGVVHMIEKIRKEYDLDVAQKVFAEAFEAVLEQAAERETGDQETEDAENQKERAALGEVQVAGSTTSST